MSKSNINIRTRQVIFTIPMLLLFFNSGLFLSCDYLDLERKLMFQTGEPLAIAANNAIVSGAVFDVGEKNLSQYGHCWAEEQNPTLGIHPATELGGKNKAGGYSSLLTGLRPETKYYMRSYVTANNGEILYGDQFEFHTAPNFYDLLMPTPSEAVAMYSKNTVVIDGVADEWEWGLSDLYECKGRLREVRNFSPEDLSCSFKVLFNEEGIMFWISVKDEKIITYEGISDYNIQTWMADYAEIYLHWGDYPTPTGEYTPDNTFQIRFNPWYSSSTIPENIYEIGLGRNGRDYRPMKNMYSYVDFTVVPSEGGYNVEAFVQWDLFAHKPGNLVYFEVFAGDADNTEVLRESISAWNNTDPETQNYEDAWNNINHFGRLLLYKPDF